jgi:hypothetical protein
MKDLNKKLTEKMIIPKDMLRILYYEGQRYYSQLAEENEERCIPPLPHLDWFLYFVISPRANIMYHDQFSLTHGETRFKISKLLDRLVYQASVTSPLHKREPTLVGDFSSSLDELVECVKRRRNVTANAISQMNQFEHKEEILAFIRKYPQDKSYKPVMKM